MQNFCLNKHVVKLKYSIRLYLEIVLRHHRILNKIFTWLLDNYFILPNVEISAKVMLMYIFHNLNKPSWQLVWCGPNRVSRFYKFCGIISLIDGQKDLRAYRTGSSCATSTSDALLVRIDVIVLQLMLKSCIH